MRHCCVCVLHAERERERKSATLVHSARPPQTQRGLVCLSWLDRPNAWRGVAESAPAAKREVNKRHVWLFRWPLLRLTPLSISLMRTRFYFVACSNKVQKIKGANKGIKSRSTRPNFVDLFAKNVRKMCCDEII
jgi:hypothetical protein